MKPHKLQLSAIVLFAGFAASAFARPIDFREVSFLVRAHDTDSSIISIASNRKLLHPLTPPQEATLRSQGASDSLIRSLRDSSLVLPASDATAYEAAQTSARTAPPDFSAKRSNVQIVDIATDRPINLSAWGGPSLDLAVRPRDIVETGRAEVELIEPTGTGFHYSTDHGFNSPGFVSIDPNYTSIWEHTFTRPLHIDWRNPVRIDDVPYLLYPIYATRGVSLYYIGRMNDDSVRLAIVNR